jgi:myo-inositol-1(or 4)-monophosphatase
MTKEDIAFCKALIIHAAEHILPIFENQERETNLKNGISQFRNVNGTVTALIRPELAKRFPSVAWSEDEFNTSKQHNNKKKEYWVCDTIDGGIHFMQGFSPWCITLALVNQGETTFSIVYEPVRKELFHAIKNGGAFLNDASIVVGNKNNFNEAIIGSSHPNNLAEDIETTEKCMMTLKLLSKKVFAFRLMGPASLQLAYVATGRLDGYIEHGDDIYDWLAGALIVTEAGGLVNSINGNKFSFGSLGIVASCSNIQAKLLLCH